MGRSPPGGSKPHGSSSFATTEWSLVLAAGEPRSDEGREELAELCGGYWYPLYAFVRRRGYEPAEAKDLTQGFFAILLEKNYVAAADRERGKFRTFLLASLKNYLANEWDRRRAVKRGGETRTISLELAAAEGRYRDEPADETTPEEIFDSRWATVQLDRALASLEEEMGAAGHARRFAALRPFLTGEDDGISYRQVANRLGISEGAVRVAIHRLRKRFGEFLRQEVARTVTGAAQIDEEVRYLLSAVRL